MKRRKKLLWALAAAVVLLTLWLWAAHIPVSALCTPLEQPEEITRLTVQVDAGESFPLEYITLQDPEEFRPILEQLDGLRVSFRGFQGASDAGIPYDPRQGDYIAVVSVAHESLYLKGTEASIPPAPASRTAAAGWLSCTAIWWSTTPRCDRRAAPLHVKPKRRLHPRGEDLSPPRRRRRDGHYPAAVRNRIRPGIGGKPAPGFALSWQGQKRVAKAGAACYIMVVIW